MFAEPKQMSFEDIGLATFSMTDSGIAQITQESMETTNELRESKCLLLTVLLEFIGL